MTGGKASLLRPEFVCRLQQTAKRFNLHTQRAGKYQWILARRVNNEWVDDSNVDVRAEIRKEDFYAECSREINKVLGFPICAASGETLRRWCEMDESYKNFRELDPLKDILSFEHFRSARHLATLPENAMETPASILAFSYSMKFTRDEMEKHFDKRKMGGVPEYERVIGWLDSLQLSELEWIRSTEDRSAYVMHLSEARKIAERYH